MKLTKNQMSKRLLIIGVLIVLLLQSVNVIPVNSAAVDSLTIKMDVSIKLFDAQLLNTDTGKIASFTVQIHNQSNENLALIDYWARIKGNGNHSYVTRLIDADKAKKYVFSKSSVNLTFYAEVEKTIALNDLYIEIIEWDFNSNNYEYIVGKLLSGGSRVTSFNSSKAFLYQNSTVETKLLSYSLYRDKQYGYLNVEATITNKTSATLDLTQLQYQAVVDDKLIYTMEPSYTEAKLKANESKLITLSTAIPVTEIGKKLQLQYMIQAGDGLNSYPLAVMELPMIKDTEATAVNVDKELNINNQKIKVKAGTSSYNSIENKTYFTTKFELLNNGSTRITAPPLSYYVKSKDGLLYPLEIENKEEINLLPNIVTTVTLTGQIPNENIIKESQVVIFQKKEEGASNNFLANFKIALSSGQDTTSNNTSNKVTYQGMVIEQVSLQRTPNENNDLIVAEFKITNQTKETKAKLNINGQFLLDGVTLPSEKTTISYLNPLLTVSPNQSYSVIAYTEIPYTQEVSKLNFKMSETTGTDSSRVINTFEAKGMQKATLLAENQTYSIERVGGRGDVKFLSSTIYSGAQSDIFYAQLEYTNTEKRAITPSTLAGYIENSNKDLVNLSISKVDTKILPGGKVILSAWAEIPHKFESSKLEMYFGEAISLAQDKGLALINPAYTVHSYKPKEISQSLENLPFMEYDLSFRYFSAYYGSSDGWLTDSIDLSFEYDLLVREGALKYSDNHSVIVEFEDTTTPKVIFSQEYKINEGSGEQVLKIGKGQKLSLKHTSNLVSLKSFEKYKINIYDVYQGKKVLVASKVMEFNTVN